MATRLVLIISNPQDNHTSRVYENIQKFNTRPILFFPEKFGSDYTLSINQTHNNEIPEIIVNTGSENINLNEVFSIWYRRPHPIHFKKHSLTDEGEDFALDEWRAAIEAMYALLKDPLWVSHPDKLRKASRKPLQLKLAQEIGFRVPRTLITNNPIQAKRFYELCDGKIILKATGAGWIYSRDNSDIKFVLTNRVNFSDIIAEDEISISPVTFQEEIPKKYEIRVNVIGSQVISVKIDSQQSKTSELDWRRYDLQNTPYAPYKLPDEIEKKCLELTRQLGLEFGAIDLIRKPDGEYVFLEINENGQFLWIEELSGSQISVALASLLAGVSPSLSNS